MKTVYIIDILMIVGLMLARWFVIPATRQK
jgi:hypothetical protein